MEQPTFRTTRLVVRPRIHADTSACLAMDGDPEVTRYVTGPWSDPVAHRDFIDARTRGPYAPGLGYWTLTRQGDPASFLGWVLLIPADGIGPEIEIGWRLPQLLWGQGLATEAAMAVLQHARTSLKLPEVIADIHPDNVASQRVAEKLGMRRGMAIFQQGTLALRYSLSLGEPASQDVPHALGPAVGRQATGGRTRARASDT